MINAHRLDVTRGEAITITFNGEAIHCFRGETVATALLAAGINEFGITRDGSPRQPLCNMGTCFDCAVVVDGVPLIRSCLSYATEGMIIESTKGE